MTKLNEVIYVEEIDGSTREGNLVLSDGARIGWDTDEEGDRVYFLIQEDTEEYPLIYTPIRGVKPEYVLACAAIENTAIEMEEGPYGKQ